MTKLWRPLKYDFEYYSNLFNQYINECKDEYERFIEKETSNEKWYKIEYSYSLKVKFPSIRWFAKYCWLNRDTLYEWIKKYPDFSDIIEELKYTQEEMLVNGWLSGRYNANITRLLLSRMWKIEERKYNLNSLNLKEFFEEKEKDVLVNNIW